MNGKEGKFGKYGKRTNEKDQNESRDAYYLWNNHRGSSRKELGGKVIDE